jgi:hypothetical protein
MRLLAINCMIFLPLGIIFGGDGWYMLPLWLGIFFTVIDYALGR